MSNRRTDLLRNPSFLWLFGGGALSMLGDQFTLIALPWVVLKLTGDPLAMGTVLATMAVPRAVLMLAGGALVDLSSAKRVLLATKYANAACLGLLAYLILAHSVSLRAIYLIALATGIVSAFSYPAGSAIIPQVVPSTQLQPANGLLMGMRQATQLLGPLLAGAVIAVFGDGNVRLGHSYRGLAVAFLIDCATFLLSAATLYKVASHSQMPGTSQSQGVFASIRNGLQALWRDQGLRAICLYSAATAFLTGGPVQVALPVVADRNLSNGAAAYGSMLAAYGAGSLIGMAVSGARPTWRLRSLGATILLIDAVAAFVLMPLGKIETVWQGVFLVGALGVLGGLIQVGVYSWIQRRVEPAMIGRAMSLFMFIFVGLAPLSAALTGWLLTIVTLERLFLGAGITLLAIILAALVGGGMAQVGGEPVCAPVAGKVASGA